MQKVQNVPEKTIAEKYAQVFNSFLNHFDYNFDENIQLDDYDFLMNDEYHDHLKNQVFNLINIKYQQKYNARIDKILTFKSTDCDDDVDILLPKDRCVHYLIKEINKIILIINDMCCESKYVYNKFIFVPYLSQLKSMNSVFLNDFCCVDVAKNNLSIITQIMNNVNEQLNTLKEIIVRANAIGVFAGTLRVFRCNICNETSNYRKFLKTNECCGYLMCFLCYANMWQFSTLYPVCPICKTSFKKPISLAVKNEHCSS
ncbi:IE-0 [Urbanus proteus nucleopolyhedrovirus]|uniref:IE-0 n=1 Tax=Urbanus proteus nucleopolyhedrovirus TaxID=1675866 RepID=A0A162GTL0_9ABAC|nr:IE-0 [Urbanus proteus nucleopolyhedrovirus]AKR17277.2 IE-0 [Urbanus proteus nucleopolyhedrovirus]